MNYIYLSYREEFIKHQKTIVNYKFRLQKILLSSQAAKLKAVRRVTQDNRGKKTAGVDGIKLIFPEKRFELANLLILNGRASPIKKVYIPKSHKKLRPLGIPTIEDRAKQFLVLNGA